MMRWKLFGLAVLAGLTASAHGPEARAGGIFGNTGLAGGFRWDATPRSFTVGDTLLERSLDGGLRYSLSGGSFQSFRDSFSWVGGAPALADFQGAVEDAFNAWTVVDPVSGLGSDLSFVADLGTAVNTAVISGVRFGAEIDIFAFNFGNSGTTGDAFFNAHSDSVTLTSGTTNYPGGGPITGADIRINNNPRATYTLGLFRLLLTHEIGHALGLADVDTNSGPGGTFIDDNYDGSTSATALATLTNSWAHLVDPFDPAASMGLSLFRVANGDPGFRTPGVNILMEGQGLGGQFGNLRPLANDDYGTRQFLYPSVIPEPSSLALAGLGGLGLALWRRGRPRAA